METIEELMVQLDGATPETVHKMAREKGSLAVRLAMLGLAAVRKAQSPLWWGYPPGIFIGYKWNGKPMQDLVAGLAEHIRGLGYRAYLDIENLDQGADAYFQIPQFIVSLQECSFYVLLLTELSGDMISARKNKTSWIFDEHQHAIRLVNSGRLFIVPVLVEPDGAIDAYRMDQMIDLTATPGDFTKLEGLLTPDPVRLSDAEVAELAATVSEFDTLFLGEQWDASDEVLLSSSHLEDAFDHLFRRMLHSLYTGNQVSFDAVMTRLHAEYGEQIVHHLYSGYCRKHRIPNRATVG